MPCMRRFLVPDAQILFGTLVVGILLGAVTAAIAGSAVVQARAGAGQIFEALALVGAGISLIVLAVRGQLMRVFLMAFTGVFVISMILIVAGRS